MSDFHKYVVSRSKSGGKFWEVEVEGCNVRTRYGKIGQEKSWSTKTHPTPEKALAAAQKKLAAKIKKGYGEEIEAWDLGARVDALVAALEESEGAEIILLKRGDPVSDAEVAEVHERIGFELDPRFLEFFRVCNGLLLLWSYKTEKTDENPWKDFLQRQEAAGRSGIINVPSLTELFTPPRCVFGEDFQRPGEYNEELLGGWDAYEVRSRMRDIDNFDVRLSESPYYQPALIEHPRFPDPPVVMLDDYAAAASDRIPMLARHYLNFVVAMAGNPRARHSALKNRGFGKNHPLFVPKETWLDGFPKAQDVIAYTLGSAHFKMREFIDTQLDELHSNRAPVEGTPYAAYNEPPPQPPRVPSEDPLEGMIHRELGGDEPDYLKDFEGDTITVPIYAPTHYAIVEQAERTVAAARALLGEPVKFVSEVMGEQVGCLIGITDDGVLTIYHESESARGTVSSPLDNASEFGRAYRLVEE